MRMSISRTYMNNKIKILSDVYWAVVLILYLAISLILGRWESTWIIWPVAAILDIAIKIVLLNKFEK